MKKRTKIILVILLVLVLLLAGLAVWQRSTISAFMQYLRHSEEDIESLLIEQDKEIEETLKKYPELNVNPLTEEQKEQIASGTLTEEDAIQLLTGQKAPDTGSGSAAQPTAPPSAAPEDDNAQVNQRISELVAKVYVLQAQFLGKLADIEASARSEIYALPKEARTYERKISIAKSKLGQLRDLEAQCDGEIAAVVSELRTLLEESGQDTSLASTIQDSYEQEKSLKKAYYMNRYL